MKSIVWIRPRKGKQEAKGCRMRRKKRRKLARASRKAARTSRRKSRRKK